MTLEEIEKVREALSLSAEHLKATRQGFDNFRVFKAVKEAQAIMSLAESDGGMD